MCVPWESNPQPFALLTQCSTTEPQEPLLTLLQIQYESIYKSYIHKIASSSKKNPALNKYVVDFDVRGKQGMDCRGSIDEQVM